MLGQDLKPLGWEVALHQGKASLQDSRGLPGGGEALESKGQGVAGHSALAPTPAGRWWRRGWGRCRGEQEGETPLYTTLLVSLQRMCPLHNSSPGCWWGIKGSFYHLPGSKYFQFATLIDVNKVMLNSEIFSSSASERWPGPPEVTGCPLSPHPSPAQIRHKARLRRPPRSTERHRGFPSFFPGRGPTSANSLHS